MESLPALMQEQQDIQHRILRLILLMVMPVSYTHLDVYKRQIEGFLNLYEPIEHKPQQGEFSHIQSLMRHIFGEQYELGMDYMQLLYLQPTQKLPIVLLVSEERNTGKSTFLNFLKAVFENNVTFNTNEDFRSQFNSDWAGKLLIVVDEVLLNRREDSERLKNLSTTFTYKVEAKGKDRTEIAFFAKFVLCSNNEYPPNRWQELQEVRAKRSGANLTDRE